MNGAARQSHPPRKQHHRPHTRFILIRHGETTWVREGRYQGSSDIGLTVRGRRQARALAARLRSQKIDFLYTSALKRARQTSRILSREIGKRSLVDSRLNEISFGRWEGKTSRQLLTRKDPAFHRWCSGVYVTPPGGEPLTRFKKRVRNFLEDALHLAKGKTIVVVTHGGIIRMMVTQVMKLKQPFWRVPVDPASVTTLDFYTRSVRLSTLNDIVHLQKDGNRE